MNHQVRPAEGWKYDQSGYDPQQLWHGDHGVGRHHFQSHDFHLAAFFLGYERPHISTCVAGAKKSFDGGILLGCKWTLCLVLLARHLPLHERIIRQLAIPESPKLQTILIQGAGLVRPARRSSTARAASTNRKHGATAFGLTTRLAPGSYSEYAFISRSRLFGSAIVFGRR